MTRAFAAVAAMTAAALLAGCTAAGTVEAADTATAPAATATTDAAPDEPTPTASPTSPDIQAMYDANVAATQPPFNVITEEISRVATAMIEIDDLEGEAYFDAMSNIEELDYAAVEQAGTDLKASVDEALAPHNDVVLAAGFDGRDDEFTEWCFHYSNTLSELWKLGDLAEQAGNSDEIVFFSMIQTLETLMTHLEAMEKIEASGDIFNA